ADFTSLSSFHSSRAYSSRPEADRDATSASISRSISFRSFLASSRSAKLFRSNSFQRFLRSSCSSGVICKAFHQRIGFVHFWKPIHQNGRKGIARINVPGQRALYEGVKLGQR